MTCMLLRGLVAVAGDSLYPSEPDYEGFQGVANSDQTIEQLRKASPNHNRLEFNFALNTSVIVCNLSRELMYGHYGPMVEDQVLQALKSRVAHL